MKLLKKGTIIVAAISICYVVGSFVLSHRELSYRMWADGLGKILLTMILPLLLFLLLGNWLYKKIPIHKVLKILLGVLAGGAYLFWIYCAFIILAFSMDMEKKLTDNLLIVNKGFLDPYYVYYRPFALFFRLPADLKDEDRQEYLEEKYGRNFGIGEETKLYDEEFPDIEVSVYVSGMEFYDNYVESVAGKYLVEGLQGLGISRDYYIARDHMGRSGWLYLELKEETDAIAFARDASQLIQYVMQKTDFFAEQRGVLCFYNGDGDGKVTGSLPFGEMSQWDEMQADYYLYPEQIAALVTERYEENKDFLKRLEEEAVNSKENVAEEDSAEQEAEQEAEQQEVVNVVEEAARAVYDTVLAAEGYSYEAKYNARGNFYLDLGSRPAGQPEDLSSSGTYRFSLVYDRTSKNGKCELFVLYKEHETEDGSNDGTAIWDMYAVEVATGEVIAADKQEWGDTGCEAYRNATGE